MNCLVKDYYFWHSCPYVLCWRITFPSVRVLKRDNCLPRRSNYLQQIGNSVCLVSMYWVQTSCRFLNHSFAVPQFENIRESRKKVTKGSLLLSLVLLLFEFMKSQVMEKYHGFYHYLQWYEIFFRYYLQKVLLLAYYLNHFLSSFLEAISSY